MQGPLTLFALRRLGMVLTMGRVFLLLAEIQKQHTQTASKKSSESLHPFHDKVKVTVTDDFLTRQSHRIIFSESVRKNNDESPRLTVTGSCDLSFWRCFQ